MTPGIETGVFICNNNFLKLLQDVKLAEAISVGTQILLSLIVKVSQIAAITQPEAASRRLSFWSIYSWLFRTVSSRHNRRNYSREEWPLLAVETEMNGDSKRTNERVPSLVGLLGLSCRYTRDFCSALAALVGQVYFLPHRTLFQFLCPHRPARWAGSRAGSLVSWCVSGHTFRDLV